MGYSRTQKGYKCWNHYTRRYTVSANVTFFEGISFCSSIGVFLDVDVLSPSSSISLPIPPSTSPSSSFPSIVQAYSFRKKSPKTKGLSAQPSLSSSLIEVPSSIDLSIALPKGTHSCT